MIVVYEKDYYDEDTGDAIFTANSKEESLRWRNKLANIMEDCNDDILTYLSLHNMDINEETKLGIKKIMDDHTVRLNDLSKKTVENYENLFVTMYYDYTLLEPLIKLMYIDSSKKLN